MKDSKFFQGKYGYILAPVACLFANPFFREKLSHYQNYELFLTLNEVISNRRIDEVIIFISKLGGDLFNRKKNYFNSLFLIYESERILFYQNITMQAIFYQIF